MCAKYTRYKIEYSDMIPVKYSDSIPVKYSDSRPVEKNILLITHSSSILCFLENIIPHQMKKYRDLHKVEKFKFKNSSIIKIELNKNGCIKISLIHDGGKNIMLKRYFTNNPEPIDNSIYFEPIIITFLDMNIFLLDLNDTNYNIFIIRHAEADHNINKRNKLQDTLLTNTGIEEAKIIGTILKDNYIDYLFCSDLRRTRQTMGIILDYIKITSTAIDIIILPCMHNLKAAGNGMCHAKIPERITIAGRMICDINSLTLCKINDFCCNVNNKKINWDYYKLKHNKKDCISKNIVQHILDYINQNVI